MIDGPVIASTAYPVHVDIPPHSLYPHTCIPDGKVSWLTPNSGPRTMRQLSIALGDTPSSSLIALTLLHMLHLGINIF